MPIKHFWKVRQDFPDLIAPMNHDKNQSKIREA